MHSGSIHAHKGSRTIQYSSQSGPSQLAIGAGGALAAPMLDQFTGKGTLILVGPTADYNMSGVLQ